MGASVATPSRERESTAPLEGASEESMVLSRVRDTARQRDVNRSILCGFLALQMSIVEFRFVAAATAAATLTRCVRKIRRDIYSRNPEIQAKGTAACPVSGILSERHSRGRPGWHSRGLVFF